MTTTQDNVPLPRNAGKPGKEEKYFFGDLKKSGDSQFYPLEHRTLDQVRGAINASHRIRRFHEEYKITTRAVTEDGIPGIRIWRL